MEKAHPSTTAYLVANGVCRIHAKPQYKGFVNDVSAHLFSAFIKQWNQDSHEWITAHKAELTILEEPITLGIEEHYVMRKNLIEQKIREFITNGGRQIINVSAGFDVLCARLCLEYPEIRFFEIDHPATQQTKLRALRSIGYAIPKNLIFCAQDWSASGFGEFANNSGFLEGIRSAFVMEGLTMYLTKHQLDGLLTDIHAHSQNGSMLIIGIFNSLLRKHDTHHQGKLQNVYAGLESVCETYQFSMPYERVSGYLSKKGFLVQSATRMGDMQRRFKAFEECDLISSQTNAENYFVTQSVPIAI